MLGRSNHNPQTTFLLISSQPYSVRKWRPRRPYLCFYGKTFICCTVALLRTSPDMSAVFQFQRQRSWCCHIQRHCGSILLLPHWKSNRRCVRKENSSSRTWRSRSGHIVCPAPLTISKLLTVDAGLVKRLYW